MIRARPCGPRTPVTCALRQNLRPSRLRTARGSRSVVGRGTSTRALDLAALALRLDTSTLGRSRRFGGHTVLRYHQRVCELGAQPLERQLAILELRPTVGGHHTNGFAESLEEASAMTFTERRRRRDVEAHLGLGVGSVRVLAARTATRREPPFELVEGNRAAPIDAQDPTRPRDGVVGHGCQAASTSSVVGMVAMKLSVCANTWST